MKGNFFVNSGTVRMGMVIMLCVVFGKTYAATSDTLKWVQVKEHATLPVKNSLVEYEITLQYPIDVSLSFQRRLHSWITDTAIQTLGDSLVDIKESSKVYGILGPAFLKRSMETIECRYEILKKEKEKNISPMNCLLDIALEKQYETSSLITYSLTIETYEGGAHGSHHKAYASFRKKDGRLLTWSDILLSKQKQKFLVTMTNELRRFFGVQTFRDMKGRLLLGEGVTQTSFPLPKTNPAFLKGCLRVQYQYYEIAPYATGAPYAETPYSSIIKCLTPMGKQFIR